jgi:YbbR domain-containing protein
MNLLRRIWAVASHNLLWKLAALLASTALWVTINGAEPNADRILSVRVSPFALPNRFVITNLSKDRVQVLVRGPRSILRTIAEDDQRIMIDLGNAEPGRMQIKVTPDMLNLPRRTRVMRIEPARVRLEIEPLARKVVAVHPKLEPSTLNGYTVTDVKATPDTVEVSGPEGRVDKLTAVDTEAIEVRPVPGHTVHEVELAWAGEGIAVRPERVQVEFAVAEKIIDRRFRGVGVEVRNAAAQATLSPAAVELTVRGPQRKLDDFTPGDGTVFVDAEGLKPGTHSLTPQVVVPEGLEVTGVSPATLRLQIASAKRR